MSVAFCTIFELVDLHDLPHLKHSSSCASAMLFREEFHKNLQLDHDSILSKVNSIHDIVAFSQHSLRINAFD